MLADILKALIDLGFRIYKDVKNGETDRWDPIIEKFPGELRSRLYHEAREARLREKLDTPGNG
jgi:hypothetical protein